MSLQILLKRGPVANLGNITPADGELILVTDSKKLKIGDGTTVGGLDLSYLGTELKGAPGGVAELDENGVVPSSQLPEFASSSTTLGGLEDVILNSPQAEDYLKFDPNANNGNGAWVNAEPQPLSVGDLADVDASSPFPDGYSLTWDAASNSWVPGKPIFEEYNFTASAGQTDFVVTAKIFSRARVYTNGVRDKNNTYTITNNGADTTISFANGKNDGDWILIEV